MSALSDFPWTHDAPNEESRDAWLDRLAAIPRRQGFFQPLGAQHSALFVKRGNTLIVSFENLHHIYRHGEDRLPWGLGKTRAGDMSVLGLMAHDWTWYRDEAVFDFFDRLKSDGFFDQFDRILFYGASMGAYAACAFSGAAPGSTVICVSPQATLDRDIAPWETRFRQAWRRDFTRPHGYAPEMITGAENVYLFYDPTAQLDSMHAVLFQGNNLTKFKCRFMGQQITSFWESMQVVNPIVNKCLQASLTPSGYYRMMRKRHDSSRYQKEILIRLRDQQRHELLVRYCNAILARRRAPAFRRELNNALKTLGRAE